MREWKLAHTALRLHDQQFFIFPNILTIHLHKMCTFGTFAGNNDALETTNLRVMASNESSKTSFAHPIPLALSADIWGDRKLQATNDIWVTIMLHRQPFQWNQLQQHWHLSESCAIDFRQTMKRHYHSVKHTHRCQSRLVLHMFDAFFIANRAIDVYPVTGNANASNWRRSDRDCLVVCCRHNRHFNLHLLAKL